MKSKNYEYIHKTITQSVDHSEPEGKSFEQHIDIIIPDGCDSSAPVFFHLGEEHELEEETLLTFYNAYGKRNDIIYIQAEHRGYGQSITSDKDQSKPSYVRIGQALADYHTVIEILKEEFNGPWIGAGYSYGGGLVINFAAKYPEDVKVILSSSGVIDWPFMMNTYDHQMRINFGDELYNGIAKHIHNLEPKELFDDQWLEREFLIAACHGLAQREELKKFQTYFLKNWLNLPTKDLLKELHKLDNDVADGEGWQYATSNAKITLNREEELTANYTWRVWRYQQCMETGVFEISENSDGIFTRNYKDFIKEGIALFGEEPPSARNPEWSPRAMLKDLKIPLVYVCGGEDPWKGLCLEPNYNINNGKYFYYPEGRHCPEKDKLRRGKQVMEVLLKYVNQ
ncbi:MAG: S28 family serine protease [Candidatus Hermodarchaeota archaeon]